MPILSTPEPFVSKKPLLSPEKVMVPLEVIPAAAAIAPELFTWNKSPLPTVNKAAGDRSPTPRLPAEFMVARAVPVRVVLLAAV